jgi:hypothetical protein
MSGLTHLNSVGHFIFLGLVFYHYKVFARHLKNISHKQNRPLLTRTALTEETAIQAVKEILNYD